MPCRGSGAHARWDDRRLLDGRRRREWTSSGHESGRAEDAQHAPGGASRGSRQESRPSVRIKLLSDGLKRRPLQPCGLEGRQPDARQPGVSAQIGNTGKRDLPRPDVAWQTMVRRKARLREPAVPLCPHGLFAFGEVETLDDRSALPPIVSRIWRFIEDVPAGGYLPPPRTGLGRRVDLQRLDGAR